MTYLNFEQANKNLEEAKSKVEYWEKKIQEEKLKEETNEFQSIKYKGKEYRIYKWTKKFKDFPIPKGFKWCPFNEFTELVNNEKFVAEKYPVYYYSWNHFELNHKNKSWELARAFLDWGGVWGSGNDGLAYSSGGGRVVLCEVKK